MAILLRLAFANSESSKRVIKLLQFSLVGKTTRYYIQTSDGPTWVFENWVSGFGSGLEYWVERKLKKAFLHFFTQCFAIFNDFSERRAHKVLQSFDKSSNMAKNEEKCLVQLTFKPFIILISGRKTQFQRSSTSLIKHLLLAPGLQKRLIFIQCILFDNELVSYLALCAFI